MKIAENRGWTFQKPFLFHQYCSEFAKNFCNMP